MSGRYRSRVRRIVDGLDAGVVTGSAVVVDPGVPPTGGTILRDGIMSSATSSIGHPQYPNNGWEFAGQSGLPISALVSCGATVDGVSPPVGLERVIRADLRQSDGLAYPDRYWLYRTMNRPGTLRIDTTGWDSTLVWFVRYPTDWLSRTAGDSMYYTDLEHHGSARGTQAACAVGMTYNNSSYTVMRRWGVTGVSGSGDYQTQFYPGIPNLQLGAWYACVVRMKYGGSNNGALQFWYGKVGTDSVVTQTVNLPTTSIGYTQSGYDIGYWYNPPFTLYGGTMGAGHVWRIYGAGFREYSASGDAINLANYILGRNV